MKTVRILFIAANPRETDQLRLSEEIKGITKSLREADFRDQLEPIQYWAVQYEDLQCALMHHKPHIVHFAGHGDSQGKIYLEDRNGYPQPLSPEITTQLFRVLKDNIKCIVLNACYTDELAESISKHIDCVIGMSEKISNSDSVQFAASFYRGIGYGRSLQESFELGCLSLGTNSAKPKIKSRSEVDPHKIYLQKRVEELTPPKEKASGKKNRLAEFMVHTLRDGQMIRSVDLPITIEGEYKFNGQYSIGCLDVWVVLQDTYGHLYLQNPPLSFFPDGRWLATNVLPGMGIVLVHFVQVDKNGVNQFRQMVDRHEWGAFESFPSNSLLLRSVPIARVK